MGRWQRATSSVSGRDLKPTNLPPRQVSCEADISAGGLLGRLLVSWNVKRGCTNGILSTQCRQNKPLL